MASRDKAHINVVLIGHGDSGKTTIVNHLINKGKSEKGKAKTEKERTITINLSFKKFETEKHQFTIIDAPGHRDYLKNMIAGTSQADVAILVVASSQDEFETDISSEGKTREHALLAYSLGIKQMIVCFNKIDHPTVSFSNERYKEMNRQLSDYLQKVGYKVDPIPFIPISGLKGSNIIEKSVNTPWYEGLTLIEALNNLEVPKRLTDQELRIPILDVFKISSIGIVALGRVQTGSVQPGMKLKFGPSNFEAKCMSLEMHCNQVRQAISGDYVGFNLRGLSLKDIHRGCVALDAKNEPSKAIISFQAQIIILNHPGKIENGYTPVIHCHTAYVACKFQTIHQQINPITGISQEENPKFIKNGDCALVTLVPTKQFYCEVFQEYLPFGRIVIRDLKQIVAVGIINKITRLDDK